MNASADWSRLTMAAADIGMFDDRKIVDVRLSTGNPGKNGAPAIVKYLDNPIDGVVTLITMPAPDWTVTKEAWWGALQRKATVVDCSPWNAHNSPPGSRQDSPATSSSCPPRRSTTSPI